MTLVRKAETLPYLWRVPGAELIILAPGFDFPYYSLKVYSDSP